MFGNPLCRAGCALRAGGFLEEDCAYYQMLNWLMAVMTQITQLTYSGLLNI